MTGTDDRVRFPVADAVLLLNHRRPFFDTNPARYHPASGTVATTPVCFLATTPEVSVQRAATRPVAPHVTIDPARAHGNNAIQTQTTGDLFRAPLLLRQPLLDPVPQRCGHLPRQAGRQMAPLARQLVRLFEPVAPATAVAPNFSADR